MANPPDTMATIEATKVTKGWKFAMLNNALEILIIVAESA